jgi:hypothetical protein
MPFRIPCRVSSLSCVGLIGIASIATPVTTYAQNSSQNSGAEQHSAVPDPTKRQEYHTQSVIFEAPPGFSDIQSLGGETKGVTFPAAAGSRRVAVRLLELQPDVLGMTSLGPREFSEYVRYRFFGITGRPQSYQTRRFMGQSVTGEVLVQSQSGSTTYLELYLVPLTQQRQLAIAFETDTEMPVGILEQTIQTVSSSLREDPKVKRKKKKRDSFGQF